VSPRNGLPFGPGITTSLEHERGYRPDIDGLRAVAIIAVVIFHAFPELLPGGFVGVDVFFVISGFLITTIILEGLKAATFSFAGFYARRVRRIFPALALVLTASLVLGWLLLLPKELEQLGRHIAGGAGFMSNFILWMEAGYFDTESELKPLMHLWSLGVEEQYYLLFPPLLWLAWRMRLDLLAVMLVVLAVSLTANLATTPRNPTTAFFLPHARFWELMAGGVLAHYSLFGWPTLDSRLRSLCSPTSSRMPRIAAESLAAAGLATIAFAIFAIDHTSAFPGWWATVPVLGTCLVILAGPQTALNTWLLASPAARMVGSISYPLYLWHWPLLSFLRVSAAGSPPASGRLAVIALAIGLAWLTFAAIERPIRSLRPSRRMVAALTGMVATAGCAGIAIMAGDGLPRRLPEQIRAIADFRYDYRHDARVGTCWLSRDDPPHAFATPCIDPRSTDGQDQPLLLVWGDSHAARLYPGLGTEHGNRWRFAQLTRDSCPPVILAGYPRCAESNRFVMAQIAHIRPRVVVLFSNWRAHVEQLDRSDTFARQLLETIREVRANGVETILLLGPAPAWKGQLPKLLFQSWQGNPSESTIPSRTRTGLIEAVGNIDRFLRDLVAGEEGVRYVSVLEAFCNAEGCMTYVFDDPSQLTTWDRGHLTTSGARFLARAPPLEPPAHHGR